MFFSETHRPNKRLCVDKTSQLMYRLIFVLAFIITGISEKRTASQEQTSFLPEMCCFPGMMGIRLLQTKAGGCHKLRLLISHFCGLVMCSQVQATSLWRTEVLLRQVLVISTFEMEYKLIHNKY